MPFEEAPAYCARLLAREVARRQVPMNNIKYNIVFCKLWNLFCVHPVSCLLFSYAACFFFTFTKHYGILHYQ